MAVFENMFSDDYLSINISLSIDYEIINFDENIDQSIYSEQLCKHLFLEETMNIIGG